MSIKMGLEFSGFDEMIRNLERAGANVKQVAEAALTETFNIVTDKVDAVMVKPMMPVGGKYWTGETKASLRKDARVYWNGTEAHIWVGFDTKNGGWPSIFLLRGTPYHEPVQELVDAFFGDQTQGEIILAQKKIFNEAMEKILQ